MKYGQGYTTAASNSYGGIYNRGDSHNRNDNHGRGYTASASNSYRGTYNKGERYNANENYGQGYTASASNSYGGTYMGSKNNEQGYPMSASNSYGERCYGNQNHHSYDSSHQQIQSSVSIDGYHGYQGRMGIHQQNGRTNSYLDQDSMMPFGNRSQHAVRNSQSHVLPRYGGYQQ